MCADSPAILLDLDGTLVDSQPGILSSCRAALRALGHEPGPMLDVSAIIGPPMDDIMRYLLAPYGDDRVAAAVAAYRADYGERGLFEGVPYAGVVEALGQMQGWGARLYLATSKRTRFAVRMLEHFGLAGFFNGIYGAEVGGALDHKPALIAHVMARHGLTPGRCVMVGDRRFDVSGAHANGMRALGVLWGYGRREELEEAGADELVTEPAGLAGAAVRMVVDGS